MRGGPASRDNAHVDIVIVFLPRVNGDDQMMVGDLAERHPASFLIAVVFIRQANGQWIVEYLACFQKAYAVFAQIAGRPAWVPIKVQVHGWASCCPRRIFSNT